MAPFYDEPLPQHRLPLETSSPLVRACMTNIRVVCRMIAARATAYTGGYVATPTEVFLRFSEYTNEAERPDHPEEQAIDTRVDCNVRAVIAYLTPTTVSIYLDLPANRSEFVTSLFPSIVTLCEHYFRGVLEGSEIIGTSLRLRLDYLAFQVDDFRQG